MKLKTCKVFVNSIMALANHCYIGLSKTMTIEWEQSKEFIGDGYGYIYQYV